MGYTARNLQSSAAREANLFAGLLIPFDFTTTSFSNTNEQTWFKQTIDVTDIDQLKYMYEKGATGGSITMKIYLDANVIANTSTAGTADLDISGYSGTMTLKVTFTHSTGAGGDSVTKFALWHLEA